MFSCHSGHISLLVVQWIIPSKTCFNEDSVMFSLNQSVINLGAGLCNVESLSTGPGCGCGLPTQRQFVGRLDVRQTTMSNKQLRQTPPEPQQVPSGATGVHDVSSPGQFWSSLAPKYGGFQQSNRLRHAETINPQSKPFVFFQVQKGLVHPLVRRFARSAAPSVGGAFRIWGDLPEELQLGSGSYTSYYTHAELQLKPLDPKLPWSYVAAGQGWVVHNFQRVGIWEFGMGVLF